MQQPPVTTDAAASPAAWPEHTAAGAGALVAAPLARRLAAALYELLLLVALTFIVQFALLPLVSPGHAGNVNTLAVPALPVQVILFCIEVGAAALYFGWLWSDGRRTLPQKTWRLRLLTRAGGVLTRKQALLRYFAAWVAPLAGIGTYALLQPLGAGKLAAIVCIGSFAWALVDRDRLFLHDRLAGTRLVRG